MSGDFRMGAWLVQPSLNTISKNGSDVQIEPKVMEVLVCLASRPGESISKETILKTVWPDAFVSDDALIRCVSELRRVFADDARAPAVIQTIPKRGYRLLTPVEHTRATTVLPISAVDKERDTESARLAEVGSTSVSTALPRAFDSLAVLPLFNATGDPETEYLSDGISESIINLLSQLPNLRVIPRSSAFRYKSREADLKVVAHDLKVRTVLTGKMIQRGDRLVVQAELVDVANDAQLWGGQFNRKLEDIFEVQEELARQISEKLRLRLTPEDETYLAKRPTENRQAYHLLLKAHYHIAKSIPEGLQRGMAYARQAIEADPLYAEAYAYISAAYSGLGLLGFVVPAEAFPRAKAAALKALEIDDSSPEAHSALGIVRLYYEWDWSGAEAALRRALELSPNYAWGHANWGDWLLIMGRHEEAVTEAQLGTELDPLSASLIFKLGQKLCYRRDYDRATEQLQKALELEPNFVWAHMLLAQVYAWKGRYEESLARCEKVASLFGGNPYSTGLRGLILAMAGRRDEANTILNDLKKQRKLDSMALISLADTYSVLGEKDEAFGFLEAAYRERVSLLIFLGVRPTLDNVRSDPRFADLLRRMGMSQVSPEAQRQAKVE